MRKILAALVCLLLAGSQAHAIANFPQSQIATLSSAGQSVTISAGPYDTVAIQVSGTFSALVLQLRTSGDGSNFVNLSVTAQQASAAVGTITEAGLYSACLANARWAQLTVTSISSGSATVNIYARSGGCNSTSGAGATAAGQASQLAALTTGVKVLASDGSTNINSMTTATVGGASSVVDATNLRRATGNLTAVLATSVTASVLGSAVELDISGMQMVAFASGNNWGTATAVFQINYDSTGENWNTVTAIGSTGGSTSSITTANSHRYYINKGALRARLYCSSFSSGTNTVYVTAFKTSALVFSQISGSAGESVSVETLDGSILGTGAAGLAVAAYLMGYSPELNTNVPVTVKVGPDGVSRVATANSPGRLNPGGIITGTVGADWSFFSTTFASGVVLSASAQQQATFFVSGSGTSGVQIAMGTIAATPTTGGIPVFVSSNAQTLESKNGIWMKALDAVSNYFITFQGRARQQ